MTPLERVAVKLAALHPAWRETPWASIGVETRELFIEDARDVLLEIREPSPAAVELVAVGTPISRGTAGDIWRAMLDAALSE